MFFKERGSLRGKNSPSRQASWNVSKKSGFPPQTGIVLFSTDEIENKLFLMEINQHFLHKVKNSKEFARNKHKMCNIKVYTCLK